MIAWIWARTVASDNAAAQGKHVPLISSFWLSSKKGNLAWLEPIVDKANGNYRFEVKTGAPNDINDISAGTKLGRGAKFKCILTGEPINEGHIKKEGKTERLGAKLIAIVAEGNRGRIYIQANPEHECKSLGDKPDGAPAEVLAYDSRYLTPPGYGIESISDFFLPRQLSALVTLSDLVKEVSTEIQGDSIKSELPPEDVEAYTIALGTFLSMVVDRCADFNNTLCRWSASNEKVMNLFGRSAIPMVWDFSEANILGDSVGAWSTCCEYVAKCIQVITTGSEKAGYTQQIDAASGTNGLDSFLISTDPPYYDNVPYADISDFFYVWLRRSIGQMQKELFGTMLVPKMQELTASPQRFENDKQKAKEHFESGFRKAFTALRDKMHPQFPLTVYYAFKQADDQSGIQSNGSVDLTTGWETLLEALISSGFQITATWPVRASQQWRMRAMGSNALASFIVLACRSRSPDASQCGRREFLNELRRTLPEALRRLKQGNVAPVDFAQAAIGPGMAVYSKYSRIIEPNGDAMTIRTALGLINQMLSEVLSEQEDEFDSDTRWALAWFEQNGFSEGKFGEAELLSKAKVTSVPGMVHTGILSSKGGKVRLLRPKELSADWKPDSGNLPTEWEVVHHLVRIYHVEQKGEMETAELMRKLGSKGEIARDLSYRLFNICEKKKLSQEAQGYNALVLAWPELARLAQEIKASTPEQTQMF